MGGLWVVVAIAAYIFLGLLLASISSAFFYTAARRTKRELKLCDHRLTTISACAPFIAWLWLGAALFIHVEISNHLAHQDCGLSGDPYVTLPNGYVVGSANTYDGYFVAPGFRTDVPTVGPGYVRSLIDLRVSDQYFSGTLLDLRTYKVRKFIFDTRTRNLSFTDPDDPTVPTAKYSDPAALEAFGAAQTSVHEDADSYWRVYDRYRHHWPNYVLFLMIVGGEGAIAFWVRAAWKRSSAQIVQES